MSIRVFLTRGLLVGCLLITGVFAQSGAPGKCDKQCRHAKSCRQGSCNHPNCPVHHRCFRVCNLKPEVLKKDAATAIADVTNRDARKALTVLYRNVKDGHVDPEIKKAMWKLLLLMKSYHFQNEHKRGHMICPSHDGSMVTKEPPIEEPAPVSRRQARRHHDGHRCADSAHHHHDPEQGQ